MILLMVLLFGTRLFELLTSGQYDFGSIASVVAPFGLMIVFCNLFKRVYTERDRHG